METNEMTLETDLSPVVAPETPKKEKKLHKKGINPLYVIVSVVFAVYLLIALVPFIYAILCSLQDGVAEYFDDKFPFPNKFRIKNFYSAWTNLEKWFGFSYLEMFLNSLWFSIMGPLCCLFYSCVVGYVCAKYRFPGRKFIHAFCVVTMMIPIVGNTGANLEFLRFLGAADSYLYPFFASSGASAQMIIVFAIFKSIDWGYAEAAFIDGAGHFRVFFTIMLPQVVSPLCALLLSDFITAWADADTPLLFYKDLPTIASGLYVLRDTVTKNLQYPIYYAAMVMGTLPTIVLFLIFQNTLMDIQIGGGLKG